MPFHFNPYMLEGWHPGLGVGADMACALDSALRCIVLYLQHRDRTPKLKRKNERGFCACVGWLREVASALSLNSKPGIPNQWMQKKLLCWQPRTKTLRYVRTFGDEDRMMVLQGLIKICCACLVLQACLQRFFWDLFSLLQDGQKMRLRNRANLESWSFLGWEWRLCSGEFQSSKDTTACEKARAR